MRFTGVTVFACWALLCSAGCAAHYADPLAVMLDREADYRHRRAAGRQAYAELRDDPRYADTLRQIIWGANQPLWQRTEAIDTLLEIDPAQTRRRLADQIMRLPDRQTLDYVIDLAATRQWSEFTGPLIRSWARPDRRVPDEQRPERRALDALHPDQTIDDVLGEVFLDRQGAWALTHHVAAWDLLSRGNRGKDALALLLREPAPPMGTLAHDLVSAWRDLHVLPRTRDEVLWLLYVGDPSASFRREAQQAVARLSDTQRADLELRHLPVLLATSGHSESRPMLLREVEATLLSPDGCRAELHDGSQPVRQWGDALSWADLLVLRTLLEAMRDRQLVAALFAQADEDLADTDTEYGGALVMDEAGRYDAQLHKPGRYRGDHVFIPPQAMIESLYTGLFHYHFHAQQYANGAYAAPGPGDLAMANRLNFNFIVLTFLDANRLNVDYYQREGVVVDLGVIQRE